MNVIHIAIDYIEGAQVESGVVFKIKKRLKVKYVSDNFEEALRQMVAKLGAKSVRLVLGDQLVYTHILSLGKKNAKKDTREEIFNEIKYLFPDDIGDGDWDYKKIDEDDKQRRYFTFAPVLWKLNLIRKALDSAGCEIEVVEPEAVSRSRNSDILIGTAAKNDIDGSDEETLNLTPVAVQNKLNSNVRPGYWVALVVVFVISTLAIFLIIRGRLQPKTAPVLPMPTESASPSPTVMAVVDFKTLKVKVLNGSGIKGEAAKVAELLRERGFVEVEIGNADNSEYFDTEVSIKKSNFSAEVEKEIEKILVDYKVEILDPLTGDANSDVLVIVGQKIK